MNEESMEQEKKHLGDPAITPSSSSGLADARSSQATDRALQPTIAPAHTLQFGDKWKLGSSEVVIIRLVGDNLYLAADANGNRLYVNTEKAK